jgi:hypothetical protein
MTREMVRLSVPDNQMVGRISKTDTHEVDYPIEIYTPERKAEFILSSAVDEEDYQAARQTVRQMGLDSERIEHYRNTQR